MRRRVALVFVTLLFLAWLPLFSAPWFGWGSRPGNSVAFTVERGDTLHEVADALKQAKLLETPRQFVMLARIFGGTPTLKAGSYRLRAGDAWQNWFEAMQQGRVAVNSITIPEGMPSILAAERLRGMPHLVGSIEVPAEGSILPETYATSIAEPRARVLRRMQAAMAETLARLWSARSKAVAVKTPEDAVILASIVEKETGKASERRLIAGVYSNRLRLGMKLDADPTVVYPTTRGKPLGRRIRKSELAADTGYNTYLRAGLPKGPITNPGRDSIAAVLDPAETDALYFVADGKGGHVFATTLAEQNINVEKWFALRRQRGEM